MYHVLGIKKKNIIKKIYGKKRQKDRNDLEIEGSKAEEAVNSRLFMSDGRDSEADSCPHVRRLSSFLPITIFLFIYLLLIFLFLNIYIYIYIIFVF